MIKQGPLTLFVDRPILTLMAALFLGERITRLRWLAVALGFAGVLVITRPGIASVHIGDLSVLAAAVGYAAVYAITKSVADKDAPLTILFYMVVVQTPIAFMCSLRDWAWPATGLSWVWVFLVGASALTGHFCMTRAFRLADASVVVPIDFLRLPLIAVVGYLAYSETIELWVAAGAVLILLGNYLNIRQAAAKT